MHIFKTFHQIMLSKPFFSSSLQLIGTINTLTWSSKLQPSHFTSASLLATSGAPMRSFMRSQVHEKQVFKRNVDQLHYMSAKMRARMLQISLQWDYFLYVMIHAFSFHVISFMFPLNAWNLWPKNQQNFLSEFFFEVLQILHFAAFLSGLRSKIVNVQVEICVYTFCLWDFWGWVCG